MKPSEIEVDKTYRNRGVGMTTRKVIAIGDEHRPPRFLSDGDPPNEPGVLFKDKHGRQYTLYLRSFAAWAGGVVE